MTIIADQAQRARALHPTTSFIVQAPAGSGKTELLTQRFLVLLANAQTNPEEIIAITFTRKAAGEMRHRIIKALQMAYTTACPAEAHAKKTWQLATRVLEKNKQMDWQLLENPNRLKIQTIDSLCGMLASHLPLLSHFGAHPNISEDVDELYEMTARELIETMEADYSWSNDLATLVMHLDNDQNKCQALLVDMLKRRDQWLPHVMNQNQRQTLENTLGEVIEEQLEKLARCFSKQSQAELLIIAKFAAANLIKDGLSSPLCLWENVESFPTPTLADFPLWQGLVKLLLTEEKQWRKKLDKRLGFPAASSAVDTTQKHYYKNMKLRIENYLASQADNFTLLKNLQNIVDLPPPVYSDEQWAIVAALISLLPVAVAKLKVLFKEFGIVDYTEVTLNAIEALGHDDSPSELALALDYKIQHILIDEFQDTSITQFTLLERLTLGWQPGDGRTLFLVGDPMQSIYRFRKAEVGLFLQAKQHGLGYIELEYIKLEVNFRSEPQIVQWINQIFTAVLPKNDDIADGAVCYSNATAFFPENPASSITLHPLVDADEKKEAAAIINTIKKIQTDSPNASIAILVLARSHLLQMMPALKQANIACRAIEIDRLTNRPVIQDLYALTRALLHPADKIAWLSILRAPWCGLQLNDILYVTNFKKTETLLESLQIIMQSTSVNTGRSPIQNFSASESLSEDAKVRLQRFLLTITKCMKHRYRYELAQWIETTWLALGGPACLENENALADVKTFFDLLKNIDINAVLADPLLLENRLNHLFASAQQHQQVNVDVMTIHRAKGLEFDVVILPALHKKTPNDNPQLLMWQERPMRSGQSQLILAPIKTHAENKLYDYLRIQENKKDEHELGRLLYVAASRTKKVLHLFSRLALDSKNNQISLPNKGSFLEKLWEPVFKKNIEENIKLDDTCIPDLNFGPAQKNRLLRRLSQHWINPFLIHPPEILSLERPEQKIGLLSLQMEKAKKIGSTLHRLFYIISKQGLSHWEPQVISDKNQFLEKLLLSFGVLPKDIPEGMRFLQKALTNIHQDQRAQWLLQPDHLNAKSEFPITLHQNKSIKHYVIDRTFVHKGICWIIDYKFALNEGNDPHFLTQQQALYQSQLEGYAQGLQQLQPHPIKLGLYFPLLPAWVEWEYAGNLLNFASPPLRA